MSALSQASASATQPAAVQIVERLEQIFDDFSSFGKGHIRSEHIEMDGRTLQKVVRDCKLRGPGLTSTDVDLIFAKVKTKGKRSISFRQFVEALDHVASRRGKSSDWVVQRLLSSGGPSHNAVTRTDNVALHDDPNAYVGVYARGGPTAIGTHENLSLNNLLDRSASDIRGIKKIIPNRNKVRANDARARLTNEQRTGKKNVPGNRMHMGRRLSDHGKSLFNMVNSVDNKGGRPSSSQQQRITAASRSNPKTKPKTSSAGGNIFDRLTDTSLYTGAHRHRFDSQGRGRGLAGRDRIGKGGGAFATAQGYAGSHNAKNYVGNTNTNTDQVFHDSSEFLMRR